MKKSRLLSDNSETGDIQPETPKPAQSRPVESDADLPRSKRRRTKRKPSEDEEVEYSIPSSTIH